MFHDCLAQGDLTITGHDDFSLVANGEDRGGVGLNHGQFGIVYETPPRHRAVRRGGHQVTGVKDARAACPLRFGRDCPLPGVAVLLQ